MKIDRKKNNLLKILMASAELAPLVKVGGLADVVSSLSPVLKKLGCDVRIIIPKYGVIDEKKFKLKKIRSGINIPTDGKVVKINLWQAKLPDSKVIIYLIEYSKFFGEKKVYYGNNTERFLFFSLSVLYVLPEIKFKPDIIHCHDFHTALIPDLLKVSDNKYFKDVKTLYTIHNLNYQGKSEIEILSTGNLSRNSLGSLTKDAQDGDINFMSQGIVNADLVNTVSPTYAKEIKTSIYGASLEKIIRNNKNKISGILNGIDVNNFNPATDKFIKVNYSLKTLKDKVKNKLILQKKLNLQQDENIAMIGFISRLDWQKGIELISEKIIKEHINEFLPCQFIFLGTGHKEYESYLRKLAKKYPNNVSAQIMFNIEIAQQIYAASDIFLMPSRFEPCGLGQIIAMRYGAVPIVRHVGGLADTVNKKVGFSFHNFSSITLSKTLNQSLNIYYNKPRKWKKLQKNGMKKDFSWNKSAQEYLKLYRNLVK